MLNTDADLFANAQAEFLLHYARDAAFRWSPDDRSQQQAFVQSQVHGRPWLDLSSESAALQILQAELVAPAPSRAEAVLLAGPIVELVSPEKLFALAAELVGPAGQLIGILPCLRDNSPESRRFSELASETLWPYYSAEEVVEMLRDAGFEPDVALTRFVTIDTFKEAVAEDRLGFKGFRGLFQRMESEGYDPFEVGWGELRVTAKLVIGWVGRGVPAEPRSR